MEYVKDVYIDYSKLILINHNKIKKMRWLKETGMHFLNRGTRAVISNFI